MDETIVVELQSWDEIGKLCELIIEKFGDK